MQPMRNTWLEEAQAGIKIAGRNINNLRYAGDKGHTPQSFFFFSFHPVLLSMVRMCVCVCNSCRRKKKSAVVASRITSVI